MSYTQTPNLLSDALERAYAQTFIEESRHMNRSGGLRKVGRALRSATVRVSRGVANVINAQAEARARDQRFSGTAW